MEKEYPRARALLEAISAPEVDVASMSVIALIAIHSELERINNNLEEEKK